MNAETYRGLYAGDTLPSMRLKHKPSYYVGVDLGQSQDYSAIAVVERAELVWPERDPVTMAFRSETLYQVRHAERIALGMAYPDVVEHVRRLVRRPPLAGQSTVVVDATGVGAPVVDLLRRGDLGCRVIPVVITGGVKESRDALRYRVPKRDLVGGLQVAFQKRQLGVAQGLRALAELREEIRSMRVRVGVDGGERFEGKRHDDLVLALALALWWARKEWG